MGVWGDGLWVFVVVLCFGFLMVFCWVCGVVVVGGFGWVLFLVGCLFLWWWVVVVVVFECMLCDNFGADASQS
ncbi:hypothetical protein, partial [Pseudomonas syringae group genomosp. 7]|uniref:hypothetical protein n=1 Tax=Pseudomonas syringae group genomosp. 7 TaxID=251699 RepID=UPI003770268D